jgi:methionyl aminopeptidase
MKPGMKMFDIVERLESKSRELIGEDGLNRGLAFPTGCTLSTFVIHFRTSVASNLVRQAVWLVHCE